MNSTYLEPFLTYTTKTYTTLGVLTESASDRTDGEWSVRVGAMASQVPMVARQPFETPCNRARPRLSSKRGWIGIPWRRSGRPSP